jgi:hypothetical protein
MRYPAAMTDAHFVNQQLATVDADCIFTRGGNITETIAVPVELSTNASFSGCVFKETAAARYIYVPADENTLIRLENCTFQLKGVTPGAQAVVLRNTENREETTKGVEDRVFSDKPIEVGVQDITVGYEETYYDPDAIEELTIVVGPNLEKAPEGAFLSGDDEALVAYRKKLVGCILAARIVIGRFCSCNCNCSCLDGWNVVLKAIRMSGRLCITA